MNAQNDTLINPNRSFSTNLKISYNSSLIYPGLRIGTETLIKRIELSKIKKSGEKQIFRDRLFTTNLSMYHHKTFHTNIYATVGYTFRRTNNKGVFIEFCPEIGYSRTFLSGTTYVVNDNGNVSVRKLAGYNYLLASVGTGVGYDFSKTKSKPLSIFCKVNFIAMYPNNDFLYMRPAIELGFVYKPHAFLLHKAKMSKKSKNRRHEN
ncbi:MAG: hypothetical protein ACRCVT_04420 [Leadbetterella sp.]